MARFNPTTVSRALLLLVSCFAYASADLGQCKQGVNCHLPDCFCPTFSHPMGPKKMPQIVYFGFDDAVTPEVGKYYQQLFTEDRLNPNGCPITMSLYVCHRYTIYSLVSEFYKESDEIAVHSVTHTYIKTAEKLREEASKQRRNIMQDASVPIPDIIGWRSPNLITAGDAQPRILKELNFTYDISLPYEASELMAFPYTLDYGYPYTCSVAPCPGRDTSHPGFWEVPVNTQFDPIKKIPCTYVDSCRPETEEDAFNFLMHNFFRSYNDQRAPFGLSMHAAWFYFPKYLAAMERFIQTILDKYDDVYIISVAQMMAWMKTPQTIAQAKTFTPWSCDPWKAKKASEREMKLLKPALKVQTPPKPVQTKKNRDFIDYSDFVDPRISLDARQNWFLKHQITLPKATHYKQPLADFVDPRISLSYKQNVFINHRHTSYEKEENKQRLSDFVDPRISLNYFQNVFIKHKATPFSHPAKKETKSRLADAVLFRKMYPKYKK